MSSPVSADWAPADVALTPAFQAWREGRLGEALDSFMRLQPERVNDPDLWRGLGSVLWSYGNFESCLAAFREAVRLAPATAMHWANVGLALRDLKQREEALAAFRVALALEPLYGPGWNECANVLFDGGDYDAALAMYDKAIEIDNTRAVVFHNRGVCHRYAGRVDAAIADFMQALRIDPSYRYTLEELARLGVDEHACASY